MIYNIDFLVASFVLLIVILYHFAEQRGLYIAKNRSFLGVILSAVLNVVLYILCAKLIDMQDASLSGFTEVCVSILYILQMLIPYTLVCHIHTTFSFKAMNKGFNISLHLLPVLMSAFIISNHWNHLLFEVNANGVFSTGPLHELIYAFMGAYFIVVALLGFFHASSLGKFKVRALVELLLFCGITIVIQSIYNEMIVSTFGVTLGILALFFTINNPSQYTDGLTGAFDIRYFRERFSHKAEKHKTMHLIMVQLTQIRHINLFLGVQAGNSVLVDTVKMLSTPGKPSLIFRISGRRFMLMVESDEEYRVARKKALDFFSSPLAADGEAVTCPAVICGLNHAENLEDPEKVLAYMEYLASLANKDSETCFIESDEASLKKFHYDQEVEQFLDEAIEKDLFTVFYQPVYSLKEKRFVTFEALSRLTHPKLGPIPPDVFISIAERKDKIAQIGLLQLRRTCQFLAGHPKLLKMADNVKINLSPVELIKPGHPDRLIAIIHEFNLPPSFFQFEITETVATEYSASVKKEGQKFVNAGMTLSIDDFGSGFANVNTVVRLPFTIVKLDRSLLTGICENQRASALYRALISSFHTMGFYIVSEGVETDEELELLREWGVDMIQGYYFSKPVSKDVLVEKFFPECRESQ